MKIDLFVILKIKIDPGNQIIGFTVDTFGKL